jgi:predicted O-methyltransferase YrrM
MTSTGKAFAHTIKYLLGLESAATQTTAAEREVIRQFAAGRKRGVEIGVFEGVSTCVIAESLARDGELIGIDPFFKGRLAICWGEIIARHKLRRARVYRKVKLIRSVSQDALGFIEGTFDFIFIDGDHSLDGIRRDWQGWSQRVARDGVILLHDTQIPSHNPAVANLGSYQYFQDTIACDERFELVAKIDSLSVLRRL